MARYLNFRRLCENSSSQLCAKRRVCTKQNMGSKSYIYKLCIYGMPGYVIGEWDLMEWNTFTNITLSPLHTTDPDIIGASR